jgi:hypothetical protein
MRKVATGSCHLEKETRWSLHMEYIIVCCVAYFKYRSMKYVYFLCPERFVYAAYHGYLYITSLLIINIKEGVKHILNEATFCHLFINICDILLYITYNVNL